MPLCLCLCVRARDVISLVVCVWWLAQPASQPSHLYLEAPVRLCCTYPLAWLTCRPPVSDSLLCCFCCSTGAAKGCTHLVLLSSPPLCPTIRLP